MTDPCSEHNPCGAHSPTAGTMDTAVPYLVVYGIAALVVGVFSLALGWLMLRHVHSESQGKRFWIAVVAPPLVLTAGFYGLAAISVAQGKMQHIFDGPIGAHLLVPFVFVVSWAVVRGLNRWIRKRNFRTASASTREQ